MFAVTRKLICTPSRFRLITRPVLSVMLLLAPVAAQSKDANKGTSAAQVLSNVGPFSPMLQHGPFLGVAAGDVLNNGSQKMDHHANIIDTQDPLFLPAKVYGTGGWEAISFAVVDVSGDKMPDILATNTYYLDTIGVLRGAGTALLVAEVLTTLVVTLRFRSPRSISIAMAKPIWWCQIRGPVMPVPGMA